MRGFNAVILAGNVTSTIEVTKPKDTTITQFTLAVNERRGEQDYANFFVCVAFGKLAEICASFLSTGKPVLVDGKLRQDRWEDQQSGKPRHRTKIICDNVIFLPSGSSDRQQKKREVEDAPSDF